MPILADAAHLLRGGGSDIFAIPQNLTRRGVDQPVDAAQQCGFARAAQPDHCQELSFGHIECDIVQRLDAPIVYLCQVFYLEHDWVLAICTNFCIIKNPACIAPIIKRKTTLIKTNSGRDFSLPEWFAVTKF
jgi:hypothetical protein